MTLRRPIATAARVAAPLAVSALLVAGCGSSSSSKTGSASASAKRASQSCAGMSSSMAGMNMSACNAASANSSSATSSTTSVDSQVSKETAAVSKSAAVDGITPVPTQALGTTTWQGMKIQAMAMTAVPFDVYDGTSMREIKPTKQTSFHLMVMLNDAQTNEPIPYSTVWATVKKAGKVVFDERQWPMISRYMGPHYGNDITVPGAGTYQLSLLVSPPVSARHMEYAGVWTQPHRVNFTFHWTPPSS